MADEFVLCRHMDSGEEMDVAVSALGYFPDWKPVFAIGGPVPAQAAPKAETAPAEPAPTKTTRASKAADQKGGDD